MGCGASKNDVIKSAKSDTLPKKEGPGSVSSAVSEASTIPAHDGDYQQNGGGSARPPKVLPPLKPLRNPREKPPEPIAFEVPAAEAEAAQDLIKKHPPRRLRQWEEKSPEVGNLTHEEIEEKVALANQRRNQVLTQRVASARQKSARGGRSRKPAMHGEHLPELEQELYGNNNWEGHGTSGLMDGGDFS